MNEDKNPRKLCQDIRRLTNSAYPPAPSDLKETLAKEQFIDAFINSDLRLRINQARPANLNDAVRHAVELEAFNRAERKYSEDQGYMRSTSEKMPEEKNSMEEDLKALQKTVSDLCKSFEGCTQQKSKQRNSSGRFKPDTLEAHKRQCFICGSDRHLKNSCPENSTSNKNNTLRFSYQKKKHQAKHVASASTGLVTVFAL